ncbi:MAG: von Willebrand factor type A domain-containing protein, partial [Chitinophagaceae bacterium]|nr:von Willebrand factor type A domain-containing protein [Chitinophagaceae bacterium]
MKQLLFLLLFLLATLHLNAQYYLRGDVKDEKGNLLPDVKINLFSKGNYAYTSGNSGYFGIPTNMEIDTITLNYQGYEILKRGIQTKKYQSLVMKMLPAMASMMKNKLASVTKNLLKEQSTFFSAMGESYSSLIENDFVATQKYPETGFALNIDRASYSNARRFINNEVLVPTDAVRIEEMLNYFDFSCLKQQIKKDEFGISTYMTNCPWNATNQLLYLNLKAPKLNLDTVPSSNFVFLIDISGSMDKPTRLPLVQAAFKMLTDNLREKDTVAIVVYGGGVYQPLLPTSGAEKQKIKTIIDSLTASGDTPGEGAITTAYNSARRSFIKNGNNRVILATDGDFNVGQTSEKQLEELIVHERQSGIYLTCLGVGMGDYKDSKLEALAKKGNGNFAYIDNLKEAEKVLVTEFTKTLYSVANDSYLNINFNAAAVKEYRLIGFDNKKTAIEDSTSELEGGEVGSGHSMIAIFEITPA